MNGTGPAGSEVVVLVRLVQHYIGIVVGVLGILCNGLVLLLFYRNGSLLADIPKKIVISQSLLDFIVGAFLIWAQTHSFNFGVHMPTDLGVDPLLYCKIIWSTFFLWGLIQASTWNLQVLTVERYISVCHPFKHRDYCKKTVIYTVLVLVWCAGFGFSQIIIHFTTFVEDNTCILGLPFEPFLIYAIGYFSLSYVVPILLMAYCYGRMIQSLRSRVGSVSSKVEEKKAKQTRAFVLTCLIMCVAYVVCYSWNVIYVCFSTFGLFPFGGNSTFYHFTVLMAFSNCFVNPIIYCVKVESFRRELRALFLCKRPGSLDESTRGGTTETSHRA